MSKVVVGLVCFGAGIVGGVGYERLTNNDTEAAITTTLEATIPTLPTDQSSTLPSQETISPNPEVVVLPLSGIICKGPNAPVTVEYVPDWSTYSLFRSIQNQYDPTEKITNPAIVPQVVAESFARDIANINYDESITSPVNPTSVIVDINDWKPNGTAPNQAVSLPTDCTYQGIIVIR